MPEVRSFFNVQGI
ncbi:hypothetical protein CP8484711_2116A, partial [Chlamydia psittaci 84-8471/1]